MSDNLDPVIERLFAAQQQSLPPDDFVPRLATRIDKKRRVRRAVRVLAIIACVILAVLGAPWLAQLTSTLIDLTATGIGAMEPLLSVPLTWFVVGATAIGCSPVIYLSRTRRW